MVFREQSRGESQGVGEGEGDRQDVVQVTR